MSHPPPSPPATPTELLEVARSAATAAAQLLADGLGRVRRDVRTKSSATDLVTEMDRAAERLIVDHILRARPDDGILGEEGAERAGSSGVRWVIDPLDGTTNYVYGHPGFAVSIAAETGAGAVAGAVLDVVHGELFTATLGGGAHRNGEPITPSSCVDLGQALVATGFSYDPARRARQAAVLTGLLPRVRDIRRMGAAAVDLCSVACGRVDAFFEVGLAPWDFAAGALVAAESGAWVGPIGRPDAGRHAIATAAPAIAEAFVALLDDTGAGDV